MGILYFILGVTLNLAVLTAPAYAITLEEQWADTNFSFKITAALINDQNCQKGSPRIYYGCTDALQALLNTIPGNELHIVRRTALIFYKPYVTLVKDLGEVQLVKIDMTKMLSGLNLEKSLLKQREFQKYLDSEMARVRITKFSNLFYEIKRMVPVRLEKAAAAAAINAYNNNVIGPRNYYVPSKIRNAAGTPTPAPLEELPEDKRPIRLGVSIFKNIKGFMVVNVTYKSGGYNAGLRPQDIITHVNNQATSSMSSEEFGDHVRGVVNTQYTLTVLRDNEILNLKVSLVPFEDLNVSAREIDNNLYIKVGGFSPGTCVDFKSALRKFSHSKAVIVDLRGNGGGRVKEMACMLSPFLGEGASTIEFTDPVTFKFVKVIPAPRPEFRDDRQVIVLTNHNSASASEAFAGAVQDYGIGFTVGLRTYGKGTAQSDFVQMAFTNTIYVKTIARYNLPSGRSPQLVGITPDFEAHYAMRPSLQERYPLFEGDTHRFPLPKAKSVGYNRHLSFDKVSNCVKAKTGAVERFQKEGDYQLQVARDVAFCAFTFSAP